MKSIRAEEIKVKTLSHLSLQDIYLTKKENTLPCGLKFYSEIEVEKLGFREYGRTDIIYYFLESKSYKSVKWLLKSKGYKLTK